MDRQEQGRRDLALLFPFLFLSMKIILTEEQETQILLRQLPNGSLEALRGAIQSWAPKAQLALLPLREGHTEREFQAHKDAWKFLFEALNDK